jgi:PAS domain S-box-containing protein
MRTSNSSKIIGSLNIDILNNLNEGIIVYDDKLSYIFSNLWFERFVPVKSNQLFGKSISEELINNIAENIPEKLKQILNGESSNFVFKTINPKTKEPLQLAINFSPLRINTSTGVLAVVSDITENQITLSKLNDLNIYLKHIIDTLPIAMIITNLDRCVEDINPAFEKVFGYSRDEIIGKSVRIVYPNNESFIKQGEIRFNAKTKIDTTPYNIEYKKKSGEHFFCETVSTPIIDSNNCISGYLSIVQDISELQISAERLKQAEKVADVGHWEFDFNTGKVFASQNAKNIYGIPQTTNFTIKKAQAFPLKKYRKMLDTELQALIEKGKPYNVEFEIKRAQDLSIRHIASIAQYNKQRNTVFGIIKDITKQKQIENEQKKLLNFNKRIINNANEGIVVYDTDLNILIWNTGMEKITGITSAKAMGKNALNILPYYKDQEINKLLFKALEGITSARNDIAYNIPLTKKKGFIREVISPNYDGNNTIIGAISIISDITQLKNAEELLREKNEEIASQNEEYLSINEEYYSINEELKNNIDEIKRINLQLEIAKKQAEESDRLKSSFLANMSHEIRTPMNSIIGFSNLLEMPDIDDEKKSQFISLIQSSGEQLMRIIDDIIDIAKIESNQLKISNQWFNLHKLLHDIIMFHKQSKIYNRKQNLQLKINFQGHYNQALIYSDPIRLKQILDNLINNAIKNTEQGKIILSIDVSETHNNQEIIFHVSDTGCGIPKVQHDLIFERFRQANLQTMNEGTGLGLSITKGIVELMKGNIWVESVPGLGSTFSFNIPVDINNTYTEEIQSPSNQNEKFDFSGKTLFIAEDDLSSFIYLKEVLSNTGITIHHVTNGIALIELLKNNIPDIVLLDINMPELNGYETIVKLRKSNIKTPVIAQTAYAMEEERKKCLSLGCDAYLAKPILPEDILKTIRKYI